jgi:hypothetical protein
MRPIKDDYLKYYRVIRYYVKAKHNISQADLDMILFLYSERYFDRGMFDEYENLVSWDKKRFERLRKNEWIEVFRARQGMKRTVYQLTFKAKRVIRDMYRKLNGEEIPTSLAQNPMFLKNVKYSDKVYRTMIKDMNKYIKENRFARDEGEYAN